jgi:hypothetical protein
MAFILKLSDAGDTIDFMSKAFKLNDAGLNVGMPPKKIIRGGESQFSPGAQLIGVSYSNRSATIQFSLSAATRDTIIDNINRIERLLDRARTRSIEEIGGRVELQYQWEGATNITYYEVIDGDLAHPDSTMGVEGILQYDGSSYHLYDMTLTLEMLPFGYPISPVSGTPTEIPLFNGSVGSPAIGGVTIFNCNDTTHDNYVEIASTDLDSELPLLVKLSLESDTGESEKNAKVYIGVRKRDLTFKHILEDDDAAFVIGSPSPTSDPDYSSGDTYTTFSFSGTTEQALIRWDLTPAETEATQGPFRIFARCKDNAYWDANANYAIAIKYGTSILYQTEWVTPLSASVNLLDLGTIFLPPWLVGTPTDLAGLSVEVRGLRKAAGTTNISLDYVALMPQDGGYRILGMRGAGLSQFETIVDDGWDRAVYSLTTGSKKVGLVYWLMPDITLLPATDQRLYFLIEGTAGSTEIDRQLIVSLYAVPQHMVLA